ncbi:MAG: ArsR family transcriptional regulator [Pelagibacterales bacterium]|nr:ArsR family transcriptional regulator [Pelagibacterales bacterium]
MLNSLITSKTRLRMLIKFFVSAANRGYLNGLANEFNESTNSIRKELNNLSDAGYLLKSKQNNKVIYNADIKHPLFKVLQKIVRQHLGLEEIVETVISRMGDLDIIALTGDYAKGIDSGIIEILIIGDKVNNKYLENLKPKIKEKISRDVDFIIDNKVPKDGIILYKKEL